MKKFAAMMIGLGLMLGTVSFAQETKSDAPKTEKKKKSPKKKKGEKKDEQKPAA